MATTTRKTQQGGVIPRDSFPIRLAIARAVMGWNYVEAGEATGINGETWRQWEKQGRRCTDPVGTARKIAAATGLSATWLIMGGPLLSDDDGDDSRSAPPVVPQVTRRVRGNGGYLPTPPPPALMRAA